jgi:hypothetical protein
MQRRNPLSFLKLCPKKGPLWRSFWFFGKELRVEALVVRQEIAEVARHCKAAMTSSVSELSS